MPKKPVSIIDKYKPQDVKRLKDGMLTKKEYIAGILLLLFSLLGFWKLIELIGGLF